MIFDIFIFQSYLPNFAKLATIAIALLMLLLLLLLRLVFSTASVLRLTAARYTCTHHRGAAEAAHSRTAIHHTLTRASCISGGGGGGIATGGAAQKLLRTIIACIQLRILAQRCIYMRCYGAGLWRAAHNVATRRAVGQRSGRSGR